MWKKNQIYQFFFSMLSLFQQAEMVLLDKEKISQPFSGIYNFLELD